MAPRQSRPLLAVLAVLLRAHFLTFKKTSWISLSETAKSLAMRVSTGWRGGSVPFWQSLAVISRGEKKKPKCRLFRALPKLPKGCRA